MSLSEPSSIYKRISTAYTALLDLSDQEVMRELQAGNNDALAIVFKRYHRLVHVTALRILRDAGEAEDITQAIFLELYRKAGQFDSAKGTLKVWLLQYAFCRCRSRRNYLLVRQFYKHTALTEVEGKESLWSRMRLPVQETERLVKEVLETLPNAQRQTIELFFFEGLTLNEIAQRTNKTFSNVRHHYYRGLQRLRACLENGLPTEDM